MGVIEPLSPTAASKLESCLFAFFLAILVWAPLPYASNRAWGGGLLALLIALVLAAWCFLYLSGKARLNAQVWSCGRLPLALLLLIQAWVAVQLLPLPRAMVEFLSPQAYAWHTAEGWLSLSLDREYGKAYLLRGSAYTAAFFLTLALVNSQPRLRLLLQTLVLSGTFQATYAAFMVFSGLELGFFVEKYTGLGLATGTFVNRNHLAGYLVMCLAAGIGLMLAQLHRRPPSGWRDSARRWLRLLLDGKVRLRIYLAIMVVALVLTRARVGNIAFFAAMALAGAISLYAGRRFSGRIITLLASLFLVDMLILGRWFGFDRLLTRLEKVNPTGEARIWSNQYTLEYIERFPFTGSGGGSFYGIFPNFQDARLEGFHVHAHNDYLEFAAELGIPAAGVLVMVVLLAFYSAYWVQRHRRTALYTGAGFAVTMTIFWVAIHSYTDFNLQIPANALTFVTLLAIAFVCRGLPGGKAAL